MLNTHIKKLRAANVCVRTRVCMGICEKITIACGVRLCAYASMRACKKIRVHVTIPCGVRGCPNACVCVRVCVDTLAHMTSA